MRNLIAAILVITIASCTGGNESTTGAVWTDYLPSFFMLAGAGILAFAGTKFLKSLKLGDNSDEGFSLKQTSFIIGLVGGIVFLFGFATYFW